MNWATYVPSKCVLFESNWIIHMTWRSDDFRDTLQKLNVGYGLGCQSFARDQGIRKSDVPKFFGVDLKVIPKTP